MAATIFAIVIMALCLVDGVYSAVTGKSLGSKPNPQYTEESVVKNNRIGGAAMIAAAVGVGLWRFCDYLGGTFVKWIGLGIIAVALICVLGSGFLVLKKKKKSETETK